MSAWGASSLVQIVSTTQSSRTSKNVINRKEAVSTGILPPVFSVGGLCRTITLSRVDFGLRSLHRKIPFPRARQLPHRAHQVERNIRETPDSIPDLIRGSQLALPIRGRVAKPLDTNSAGQATFDRCLHEPWCDECERDGHVDLTHAAFLTRGDLFNVSDKAGDDLIKPTATPCNCIDKTRAPFDPGRTNFTSEATDGHEHLSGLSWTAVFPKGSTKSLHPSNQLLPCRPL